MKIKLNNAEIEIEAVRPHRGPSPIESPYGGDVNPTGQAVLLVLKNGQSIQGPEGKRLTYPGGTFIISTAILTLDGLYVSE